MLARWLQLKPGESRTVGLLFGWYFCVIGATFIARAVRDALFLAHIGAAKLPVMYIATPLVVTGVGFAYARIESRWRRDSIAVVTAASAAALFVIARTLLGTGDWIFYALYIAVSVVSVLVIMQLWTVASDRFTARDAKRVFGLIGAGGTAADIAIGAVIAVLAPKLGAENLLWVAAGLFATAAGLALRSRRAVAHLQSRPKVTAAATEQVPGTSHLRLVAVAVVLAVVVVTLVEFQFKAVTAAHFGADREGMVKYFGWMSVGTGVVSLVIQVIATRWMLQRLGVAGALLVLPLALAAGEVGLLLVPGLVAATVLKAGDETFRFTVNDAASQLLFVPVPSRVRGRWKALVDSGWKPAAQLALGMVLLAYRAVAAGRIAPLVVLGLVAIAIWLGAIVRLRPAYVRALAETLRQRPAALEGSALSAEELEALRAALARRGDPAELVAALSLAGAAAYELVPLIAPLCADASVEVRRAAAAALVDVPGEAARRILRGSLIDPEPELRDLACAALFGREPTADSAVAGLATGSAIDRIRAAEILGTAANKPATLPLLTRLLADPDLRVARAAMVPLAEAGGTDVLLDQLATETASRTALCRALARHRGPIDRTRVIEVLDRELAAAYRDLAAAEALGPAETSARTDGTFAPPVFARADPQAIAGLLAATLRDRQDRHAERVFALLEALVPDGAIARIAANLKEATPVRRANAIEVLESALPADLRKRVMPLVDDSPRYVKLRAAREAYPIPELDRAAWVHALLADDSAWLVACVAYYALAHGIGGELPEMMTVVERVLLLKGVELFEAVPSDELAAIARIATEVRIEAGRPVLREGEPGDSLYFVVEGRAAVHKDGRAIAELGERGVFGELALLDPGPRSASVDATTDLVLLEIKRDDFVEILATHPEVPLGVIKMLARRAREAIA